jgi:HEPN domain-containing protein
MQKEELIRYWADASDVDYRAMNNLYASKDYVWALFLGHLIIEKLLKGLATKNGITSVLKIHDLNKLAKTAKLEIDETMKDFFDILTSFNIEARYPDYKNEFFKKCTAEFSSDYITKIKELRLWLLEQLKK